MEESLPKLLNGNENVWIRSVFCAVLRCTLTDAQQVDVDLIRNCLPTTVGLHRPPGFIASTNNLTLVCWIWPIGKETSIRRTKT